MKLLLHSADKKLMVGIATVNGEETVVCNDIELFANATAQSIVIGTPAEKSAALTLMRIAEEKDIVVTELASLIPIPAEH